MTPRCTLSHSHTVNSLYTSSQALSRSKYSETLLVLFGQYSSILILDSNSLETVCTLRSGCKPNWNAAISFLLNPDKKGKEAGGEVWLHLFKSFTQLYFTPFSCK